MMNDVGRPRIPFRRVPRTNPSSDRPNPPPELRNIHAPTPKEYAAVKRTLGKATNFPPELIDIIMDFAEYWACSIASIDYSVTANGHLAVHGGRPGEDKFVVSPSISHKAMMLFLLILDLSFEPNRWVLLHGIRPTKNSGKQQPLRANWVKNTREQNSSASSRDLPQP